MADPQQLQQQVQALNDQLDILNDNFNNISNKLGKDLKKALSDLSVDAGEFINKFERGQKVTASLGSKLISIQKQANRLSIDRTDLESKLNQAIRDRNFKQQKSIEKKLVENKYATQQLELNQSLLIKLKQIVDEEDNRKKKLEEEAILEKSIYLQAKKRYEFLKTSLTGIFTYLLTAFKVVDQATTDVAKSTGITKEAAKDLVDQFDKYAKSVGDSFVSLQKLAKAQTELNAQLGIAVRYSAEELETFARLTTIMGLTSDEAGKLAQFSAASGVSIESYVNNIREGAFAAQLSTKTHFTSKQILQDISKLSAGILVKFQGNPKAIAQAVVQAKALGTSLEQVDKTAESLLNFESSIGAELEAELITGRQLNFERARAAALTGDQVTLMEEMAAQAGSLAEFQDMNVIAQQSLAQAFGMSASEMAEMLMKQEAIAKYGDEAAKLNQEQLDYMQKNNLTAAQMVEKIDNQRSAQEKFNDAMEKIQGIVGELVSGPFGQLAELMGKILDSTAGLAAIMAVYIGRQVFSLGLSILDYQAKKRAAKMNAVDASLEIAKSTAKIPGMGLAAAALAAAAFVGFTALLSKADDFISPGYGKRMILSPEGTVALNDNDTIVAGTNLGGKGGGGSSNDGVIAAIANLTNIMSKQPTPQFALNVGGEQIGAVVGKQQSTGTQQTINSYKLA